MAALPIEDGTLWYDVAGSGQTLVFLHGGWMNGDAWAGQVERFAGDYRVVTLDLRGHGRTGGTDVRRYSVGLFADDLERLLAHLDATEPIVCGLSLGNLVAQEYLARNPDRPAGAVFGGPVRSMPPVDLPAGLKPLVSPVAGIETSLCLAGSKATFRSMLGSIRAATGRPWISTDAETRAEAIELAGSVPRSEFSKIFDALYRFEPPDLSHVETPTLAVYGEREAALVKRQARRLVDAVEDASLSVIPEAAHLVNLDNPAAFNARVADFLADVEIVG